jgi:ABC-2 type transport system permease protein
MRQTWAIAMREIRSQVVSPVAWTVAAGFLLISGYVFVNLVLRFAELVDRYSVHAELTRNPALLEGLNLNDFVVRGLYGQVLVLLLFLAPAITMRAFAEERRQGTEELLLSAPVTPARIVAGKFLGLGTVLAVIVLSAGGYVVGLSVLGDPEPGPAWTGMLGLLLATLALTAIGIAISATTESQAVAGVGSFVVGLLLFVIGWPARDVGEGLGRVLTGLSMPARFERLAGGLVTAADVTYFLSIAAAGLFAAWIVVSSRRWR